MGARRWIAAVVVVAVVGIAVGWVAWPHGHSASAAPFTAEFGVPRLDRTTGRVSASGSITNVLSRSARFEVHLDCNPPDRHIVGFGLHSRLIRIAPGASSAWAARSAALRTVARPGHPSGRVPRSTLAHLRTWVSCAYWVATPGVPQ